MAPHLVFGGRVSLSLELLNSARLANSELWGASHRHLPSVGIPVCTMVQHPHECWESELVPYALGAGSFPSPCLIFSCSFLLTAVNTGFPLKGCAPGDRDWENPPLEWAVPEVPF